MSTNKLNDILLSLVRRYGFERVEQSLRIVHDLDRNKKHTSMESKYRRSETSRELSTLKKRPRTRITASNFISKMSLEPDKLLILTQLADNFDSKEFLPTIRDIRLFCNHHGLDEPSSNTRAAAISRIFKFLSSIPTSHAEEILRTGMYSGPSRLGPIADAIRRNARYAAASESPHSTPDPENLSSDNPNPKPPNSSLSARKRSS